MKGEIHWRRLSNTIRDLLVDWECCYGSIETLLSPFNEIAFRVGDEAYKRYADSVFQVSVSANRQMYDLLLREDEKMCEALRDLLKEDFAAAEAKAEKKGEIKGVILLYHDEMGFTDAEITDRIVKRFLLDKDVAEELVRETLALQMV